MSKQLSTHAAAAAQIRAMLKAQRIKARVRSRSFSMGDSVDVKILQDVLPATFKRIAEFVGGYQYGHFDGMIDCYEYSNRRDDLPQVKFAHVSVEYSDAIRAEVRAYVEERYASRSGHDYDTLAWRILNGSEECDFWTSRKARVRALTTSK